MGKLKKLLAVILSALFVASSCCLWAYSTFVKRDVESNVLLLETLKKDRAWVIESLIDGNFKNNPYADICYSPDNSFLDTVLKNYQENSSYKLLVDAMNAYHNKEDYVKSWTQEQIVALINFLSSSDEACMKKRVDTLVKTADDLQYENIINDILVSNYTSSWGVTLFEEDADIEHYREMSKMIKKISNFQEVLLKGQSVYSQNGFDDSDDFMDYADNFLTVYDNCLYDAVTSLPGCGQFQDKTGLKKLTGLVATCFALNAQLYSPIGEKPGNLQELSIFELYDQLIAKEINGFLKFHNKEMKICSIATEYAMLLESLLSQKDSTVQVMNRLRDYTIYNELNSSLSVYANMVEDMGNKKALAYDVIVDYLSNQNKIGEDVFKVAGNLFEKYGPAVKINLGGEELVSVKSIGDELVKAGRCLKVAMWVADKATNIEDTAKKIYLCKYIKIVEKEASDMARFHLDLYNKKPTEENAKIVIDDLEFLKRIRLYGDTQGYKTVCLQNDSVVGSLMGGNLNRESLDKMYQGRVDAVLGCTITTPTNVHLVLNKGDELTVMPWNLSNGQKTMLGSFTKADGTKFDFPEADNILMGAITLNGGVMTVIDYNAVKDVRPIIAISNFNITAPSEMKIRGSDMYIGNFKNTSNLTLTTLDNSATVQILDKVENTGTLKFATLGQCVSAKVVENSGNLIMPVGKMEIYGPYTNTGTTEAVINLCGDKPGGITELYCNNYEEKVRQTIYGNGTNKGMFISNPSKLGVRAVGTQIVTDSFQNEATPVHNGENIILPNTCKIFGNYIPHSITLQNYVVNESLTIKGTLHVKEALTVNKQSKLNGGLNIPSDCKTVTVNAPLLIGGDMLYAGGVINGTDGIRVKGDVNITKSNPQIPKIDFVGGSKQKLSCSSDVSVGDFGNHNNSFEGLTIEPVVHVNGSISTGNQYSFKNAGKVVLTGNAKINGGVLRGNISANNWNCNSSAKIKGSLHLTGDNVICENVSLMADCINLKSGTVNNSGNVSAIDDLKLAGNFSGGTLNIKGNVSGNGNLTLDTLNFISNTKQDFYNLGKTAVNKLSVENNSLRYFTVGNVIEVAKSYTNKCKRVLNGENIKLKPGAAFISEGKTKSNLSLEDAYTVKSGETLIVNGSLFLSNTSKLTVEDGGKLIVNNSMKSNGSNINILGELIVNEDAKIDSSTLGGSGIITFNGDLSTSQCTWNNPNLSFKGKVSQTIDGSIKVNNLNIENKNNLGITFNSRVSYVGSLSTNNSVINGQSNLVKA